MCNVSKLLDKIFEYVKMNHRVKEVNMRKLIFLFVVVLLFSCNRDRFVFNLHNVNYVAENIVLSFIDQEKIDFISVTSWGTTDYGRNLDLIRIGIYFNQGNWNNLLMHNEIIENELLDNVYTEFSKLNNNNVLRLENIHITPFYPFRIIFPTMIKLSIEEKENLESLLWENFQMEHVLTIKENYSEGWIDNNTDFDCFINFMKIQFGNDIIVEI